MNKIPSPNRVQTRSGSNNKTSPPGLNVQEKVAKLIKEQSEIKKKLDETVKQAEEEKTGLLNEIKSLELALKMTQEDHKNEIVKLQDMMRVMSEEIQNLKIVAKKDTKTESQPLIKQTKQTNKLSRPSSSGKGVDQNVSYAEVVKMANKPGVSTKNKNSRVLLLADSHGRGCSSLLSKKLKTFCDVEVVFKPNAPLNVVVESAREQVKDFNENDYLIVLGGTNNITENTNKHLPHVITTINEIVPLSQKTNVIINTIPVRFDRPELNRVINETNETIHATINNQKNKNVKQLGICFLNERLKREHYTKHGLHLNESGKMILCNRLTELIESRLQSPVHVNKSPNQTPNETFLVKWLKTGKGK